jgi:hypothetical protein
MRDLRVVGSLHREPQVIQCSDDVLIVTDSAEDMRAHMGVRVDKARHDNPASPTHHTSVSHSSQLMVIEPSS